jgi:phospholipid/cholesterol/gamma-HCH transport system substrate-binding protein
MTFSVAGALRHLETMSLGRRLNTNLFFKGIAMTHDVREVLVGVLVLLGVGLLLAYIAVGKPVAATVTESDYTLNATFNRVDGLLLGAEVRMGGIRVGTVEGYKLGADYRAVMTVRVNSSVKLPLDSSIAIHTDGLFGAKFVVLEAGGDEENLSPGSEVEYTQDPVIISDLLDLIISQGQTAQEKRSDGKNEKKVGAAGTQGVN